MAQPFFDEGVRTSFEDIQIDLNRYDGLLADFNAAMVLDRPAITQAMRERIARVAAW